MFACIDQITLVAVLLNSCKSREKQNYSKPIHIDLSDRRSRVKSPTVTDMEEGSNLTIPRKARWGPSSSRITGHGFEQNLSVESDHMLRSPSSPVAPLRPPCPSPRRRRSFCSSPFNPDSKFDYPGYSSPSFRGDHLSRTPSRQFDFVHHIEAFYLKSGQSPPTAGLTVKRNSTP